MPAPRIISDFHITDYLFRQKGIKVESNFLKTGAHYFELMKLKLAAGRSFHADGTGDYGKAMIINEKLAFQLGWKPGDAIGKQIRTSDTSVCTVIGVMKDFTQNTLFDPIQPVAMVLTTPDKYTRIMVRAKPGNHQHRVCGSQNSLGQTLSHKTIHGILSG